MNQKLNIKYNQRLKDYKDTLLLKEPSEILIHGDILTAQVGYYGLTVQQCLSDNETYIKKCTRLYDDFDIDFACNPLINPLEAVDALSRKTFFVSEDGVTVQHQQDTPMKESEYGELAINTENFLWGTLAARKFPELIKGNEEAYQKLKNAACKYRNFLSLSSAYLDYAKEKYGVLQLSMAKSYAPLDVIFDRLRGFEGTLTDMRRHGNEIADACEALLNIYIKPLEKLNALVPHAITTVHCPAYLRKADFEKYYWPTYRKMLEYTRNRGSVTLIDLEGNMKRFYEYFTDIPLGTVALMVGDEDIFEAADILNGKIAYFGNYPLSFMKYENKEKCVDLAKRMCDKCAPGGGFVFCSDLPALSTSDINPENMQAVYHTVKEMTY